MRNNKRENHTLYCSIYFSQISFLYFPQQEKYPNNNANCIYFKKQWPLHYLFSPWFAAILAMCIRYNSSTSIKASHSIPHLLGTHSICTIPSENVPIYLCCFAIHLWTPHEKGTARAKARDQQKKLRNLSYIFLFNT